MSISNSIIIKYIIDIYYITIRIHYWGKMLFSLGQSR